jgi:Autotransporter beta-domain
VLPTLGVTPYGAVQFQDFYTPAYSESDVGGGGFGLSYASTNATDVRTELGSRFDAPTIVYGKPVILYGRLAWAHDFVNAPSMNAISSFARLKLYGDRRADRKRLGTHHRRRPSLLHAELIFARQVRRRICQRLADLRRLRHGTLYLVEKVAK